MPREKKASSLLEDIINSVRKIERKNKIMQDALKKIKNERGSGSAYGVAVIALLDCDKIDAEK